MRRERKTGTKKEGKMIQEMNKGGKEASGKDEEKKKKRIREKMEYGKASEDTEGEIDYTGDE